MTGRGRERRICSEGKTERTEAIMGVCLASPAAAGIAGVGGGGGEGSRGEREVEGCVVGTEIR